MDDPTPLGPPIDGWIISKPDGDGLVWITFIDDADPPSSKTFQLGHISDVRDKMCDWLESFDPE